MFINGIDTQTIKKWGIIIGFLFIVFIVFMVYFTNTWLYITTDSQTAKIAIFKGTIVVKESSGSTLFTTLPPGSTYSITVTDNKGVSSKLIKARGGAIFTENIKNQPTVNLERVIGSSGTSISASSQRIAFINNSSRHGIDIYTSEGIYQNIRPQETFTDVSWIDPTFGVTVYIPHGEGIQNDPKIGLLSGDTLSDIIAPTTLLNKNYSIKPAKNKDIYLSVGDTLYRKSLSSNTFSPIYRAKNGNIVTVLTAADTMSVIFESQKNSEIMSGTVSVVEVTGKVTSTINATQIANPTSRESAYISPDGKYITLIFNGVATIYDNMLENPVELPSPGVISSFTWIKNNEALYTSENIIWHFVVGNSSVQALAIDSSDRTLSELSVDTGGKFAYFSAYGTKSNNSISLVSLTNSAPLIDSALAVKLSTALPRTVALATCRADYFLFIKPVVIITKLSESNQQTQQQNTQLCIDDTKTYLTKQGINLSTLQFTTVTTDSMGKLTNY